MSTTLFIAEKPSMGRMIADAIGGARRAEGAIECAGNVVVTWAVGHLLSPLDPEDYDPELKQWSWDTLPLSPKAFRHKPKDSGANKQLKVISALLKRASKVVVATDADREGELICYLILHHLKWDPQQNTARLWLSDLTPSAVKKAIVNLRPIADTIPLAHAALARQRADWLTGLNMTRATTLALRSQGESSLFSIGRVQTPTLALIVRREREIRAFKPSDYYELIAEILADDGTRILMRHSPAPDDRILDRAKAESLMSRAEGARGPIRVSEQAKKQAPPKLFDLDRLQQQCNTRFGWSADKTLSLVQALYETHQLLTYPRTDCPYLPTEHQNAAPDILGNLLDLPQFHAFHGLDQSPIFRKQTYDDKKITAHHAIVPTDKKADLSTLNADEAKLYDLVARYFIAAHMPDHEYIAKRLSFEANGVPFKATGKTPTKGGWRDVFGGEDEVSETARSASARPPASADGSDNASGGPHDEEVDDALNAALPDIADGTPGLAASVKLDAKTTKPPPRFTEASLLEAMKSIARFVDDEKAKKVLNDTAGIGTPATRARIIEVLKKRKFIETKKRNLVPTDIGEHLITAVEKTIPSYADPVFTAFWEQKLDGIATRQVNPADFVKHITQKVITDIQAIKDSEAMKAARGAVGSPSRNRGRKDAPRAGSRRGAGTPGARSSTQLAGSAASGRPFSPPPDASKITRLKVSFDDRDKAKALGARWHGEAKTWYIPEGKDPEPFRAAGFL